LVHAKPAWTAGAGSKEHVVIQNLLPRHTFLLQKLQILDEIAHREIRRVALTVVPEFLARLKRRHVWNRQFFAPIPASLEHRANQVLVLPGKASKQNGDARPLLCRKSALHWPVEVLRRIKSRDFAQTRALRLQAFFDFCFVPNLNETRRHDSSTELNFKGLKN